MIALVKKFASLFKMKPPKIKPDASNFDIRYYWQRRKERLRLDVSFFFTVLNIVGMEFASPHYSMSEKIIEALMNNSSFVKLLLFTKLFPYSAELPKAILLTFVLCLVWIFSYVIQYWDPFSNARLLRYVGSRRKKKVIKRLISSDFAPWMKEITVYAKYLPSNNLPAVCDECENPCDKRRRVKSPQRIQLWGQMFSALSVAFVNKLCETAYECRKAFFLKYGFLMSAFALFLGYILARIIEYMIGLDTKFNPILLSFIIGCLFLYVIFSLTHPPSAEKRGIWGVFKEETENLLSSPEFKSLFKKNVCT